jgi:hypothetical protein
VDWSWCQPGPISPVTRVRVPPPPIGCRSTAGRCPVKAAIGVRIPAPERKIPGDVAQPVSALPRQGRRYGFESRRHREQHSSSPCGETEIIPDYESGVAGSNPAGDAEVYRLSAMNPPPGSRRSVPPEFGIPCCAAANGVGDIPSLKPGWRNGSASLLQSESGGSTPSLGTAVMV